MLRRPQRWQLRLPRPLSTSHRLTISSRREYASVVGLDSYPDIGAQMYGFTLMRKKHVRELDLTAIHLQHNKTGAEYLHVAREDQNNVFSIGFKTNPPDNTGLPHILEHLALCGSEKYPVRDPFFKMMPRSLSNFMNAMTYPDHTVYPFATTNAQDFKNLLSVYIDSTLHPLLRYHDFAQEGWRVGPENPQLESSADSAENSLIFKGVVYNEMKGAMSSADSLFATRFQENIIPALNNSGGDPQIMTNLTHEQLKNYHSEHYHPSNSKLFTYGNIPLEEHLKEIGPQLDVFNRINADHLPIAPISLDEGAKSITVKGPTDPLYPKDQQYKASISWLMCDTSDILETFSLGVISSILLEGFSSPLYQNTIGVGWGAGYSPNTGLDTSGKIGIFSVGLSGIKKQDIARLNGGIKNTLLSVKRSGFDPAKIDGRLHQIELALKHKTAHFGMGLMSRLQDGWFNGVDPFATVAPEEIINAFKARMQDDGHLEGGYLMELFEKYWLHDNTLTFVMEPSEQFEQELVAEEASRLDKKIEDITQEYPTAEAARKGLEKQETELLDIQNSGGMENLECLPTVHVQDVPRQFERKELRHSSIDDTKVQWREAPTNGLTYFRAIQTLENLPDSLRIYLPLFSTTVQRLGTKKLTTEALEDKIRLKTGGISVGHHATTSPYDLDKCSEGVSFAGHALDRNVPDMYDLLQHTVRETNFDSRNVEEVLSELIKGAASTAVNDIAESGHAYALRYATAGISPEARLSEELDGLTQTRLMMDLASRKSGQGFEDVITHLKDIQSFLLSAPKSSLRVALTCSPESTSANEEHLSKFLSNLPSSSTPPTDNDQLPYPANTKSFFPLPYQVYYAARALRTVPYTSPSSPPLQLLAELLTHKRLHPEIREKGGAYGAFGSHSALRGTFGFATYRDPNPLNSLRVMDESGKWAAEREWTDREMDEAKLSVFQSVDAPVSVSSEGMINFLSGVDDDMRQERRQRLLDVTAKQVRDAAQEFLVDKPHNGGQSNVAVLGKKADWVDENEWLIMPLGTGGAAAGGEGDDEGIITL